MITGVLVAFAAAFLAGAINSVAGGGTLLTFPALVWLGLPSVTANATSTVSIWPGSMGAMWGYRKELKAVNPRFYLLAIPSIVGGITGAILLRLTPPPIFDQLVPLLILFATVLFAVQDPIQRRFGPGQHAPHQRGWMAGAMLFQLGVSIYGGYFGAGMGILMLAALGIMGMDDIHEMNAIKTFLALFINGVAAAYFVMRGMVSWWQAVPLIAGSIAGGLWGAGFARRIGRQGVRIAVIVIGVGMALSLAVLR